MKKALSIAILYLVTSSLFCISIDKREGRVNPFDQNGDNWFPPTVDIIKDTITGNVGDTIEVKVKVNDQNGTPNSLNWTSEPAFIDLMTDTITSFTASDTTYKDTVVEKDTLVDTTILVETKCDSTMDSTFQKTVLDTVRIITINDSLLYDTLLTYLSTSDTTYRYELADSIYIIYRTAPHDTAIMVTLLKDINVVDSIYDLFSLTFQLDTAGTFTLFVTAVDNDGVESVEEDSVVIIISLEELTDKTRPIIQTPDDG